MRNKRLAADGQYQLPYILTETTPSSPHSVAYFIGIVDHLTLFVSEVPIVDFSTWFSFCCAAESESKLECWQR